LELNQPPVELPATAADRWPYAREFLALLHALDGNMIDATVLCLLIEDQYAGKDRSATFRDLAVRSRGMFVPQAVTRCIERLSQLGFIRVVSTKPRLKCEVNLDAVFKAIGEAEEQLDALFLALHELAEGNFRDALMMFLLIRAGGDRIPTKMTGGDAVRRLKGFYANPADTLRSLLTIAPWKGGGLARQDAYRYWSVDSVSINSLLAQRMAEWSARGCPDEPWTPGLRLALASGSIPGGNAD
jgi:hypothetical protein